MKLYVGNLPNSMTEDELASVIKEYGEIQSIKIILDRETGRSRGFGFVEMSDNAGRKVIEDMNNSEIQGRKITVNLAQEKPRNERRSY